MRRRRRRYRKAIVSCSATLGVRSGARTAKVYRGINQRSLGRGEVKDRRGMAGVDPEVAHLAGEAPSILGAHHDDFLRIDLRPGDEVQARGIRRFQGTDHLVSHAIVRTVGCRPEGVNSKTAYHLAYVGTAEVRGALRRSQHPRVVRLRIARKVAE